MNPDAKIFVENDPQVKVTVPTLCAIVRKMRVETHADLPPREHSMYERAAARKKLCKENLDDLINDMVAVRTLCNEINAGGGTYLIKPALGPVDSVA